MKYELLPLTKLFVWFFNVDPDRYCPSTYCRSNR
jgi:hypothetical protein